MNEVLLTLAAAGVFFGAIGLRGVFGYLKNKKVADLDFDWRLFIGGSLNPIAMTLGFGALASLVLGFLKLVALSEIPVAGIDQISVQNLLIGLFIADIGAIGLALKEALLAIGLSEKQIDQIRETAGNVDDENALGISIKNVNGEIVASAETVTKKTVKEQLAEDGVEVDDGEEVEPGKGSSNTYPNPYRSAAPDTLVDPSTCYNRECVSYVAWKIAEVKGKWPPRTGDMNAKNWLQRLPSWGYRQVSAPVEGGKYVGVLPQGTYGHVVWYEYGNTISEYNYNYQHNYGMRAINLSQYTWFEIVAPPAPAPTPAPAPAPAKKSAEQVADEIWKGVGGWGNDPERSQKIRAAGLDPAEVASVIQNKYYGNQPAAPKPTGDYHTVRKGETLGQIALDEGWATAGQLWGANGYVNKLAARNNIANADLINVGDKIYKA